MRINIPASIEEVGERLTGIESLLTAQRWERAAIVAAFVRRNDGPGGDGSNQHGAILTSENCLSPTKFAALGISGLKSSNTVQLYVNRWLEHSEGVYPEPGAAIELPDTEWDTPNTRPARGYESPEGMNTAIERMVETHGADVVASAITETAPEVVEVVEQSAREERLESFNPAPPLTETPNSHVGYLTVKRRFRKVTTELRAINSFLDTTNNNLDGDSREGWQEELTAMANEVAILQARMSTDMDSALSDLLDG